MDAPRFVAAFATAAEFLTAFDLQITTGGLFVRGAEAPGAIAMGACTVEVRVAGSTVEVPARIAAVALGAGVAVLFDKVPDALQTLAARLRDGDSGADEVTTEDVSDDPSPRGALFDRLASLTTAQKIQLAMGGTREERFALLRDINRSLHAFVLRNPRIALDEVRFAAKLSSLSPDAIKVIAEHPDWSQNAGVCASLVRNPKTPVPTAVRLLERVSATELRLVARGGARQPIVLAARKLLGA